MKKILALCLSLVLCIGMITGCTKTKESNESSTSEATPTVATTPSAQITEQAEATPTKEAAPTGASGSTDTNTGDKIDIQIAALKGPTAIGMAKIMKDNQGSATANNYNFTIAGTADEISAGLISGDIQIAAVPCNLASVLYNKTKGGVKVAGINTLSVLYIVETGDSIKSVADLKGKTIYSTGKGTTPEYTLNYLLKASGIDPAKDVTIEYKSEATEVAAVLSEATDAIAMLPEPYVTTVMKQNDKVRIALDIAKEWANISTDGSTVVTGVVVVNTKFLEENVDAVNAFLDEYAASATYVNENVEEAASIVEEFDIVKAEIAKVAIPSCNITFIEGQEMKEKITGYLLVLASQEPKSVGGTIPDDNFYYMR